MTFRRYLPLVAAVLAVVPASASAQSASPAVTLETAGTQPFERGIVALAGDTVSATARAANAAPGSTLTLTFSQGGRTVKTVRQTAVAGAGEVTGSTARPPGVLNVRAQLSGPGSGSAAANGGSNAESAAANPSATARVDVLEPSSDVGSRGLRVRFLQDRLAKLGFAIRHTGVHDFSTSNAVMAHRKVLGLERVGTSNPTEYRAAAAGRGAYVVRYPGAGRHVEADLTRQVLALIEPGGRIAAVYHTSSGRPRFKTPTGVHRFWRKEFGLNDRGMLHTVYFTHDKTTEPTRPACGIHGYFVVPPYANSHCCFRVPLADALIIYRWARIGERIYVYRS